MKPLALVTGVRRVRRLASRASACSPTAGGSSASTRSRDYYPRADKEANLAALADEPDFELVEARPRAAPLEPLLARPAVVFHLAAQPGVRGSFGDGFPDYLRDNVLATQRLFEAACEPGCARVVWASSSSVYGDAAAYPCREDATPTAPRSPLRRDEARLRGPRRHLPRARPRRRRPALLHGLRPAPAARHGDAAALRGAARGTPFPLYGDGAQSRDFTHVDDAVDATVRAGSADAPAPLFNVGGGEEATLAERDRRSASHSPAAGLVARPAARPSPATCAAPAQTRRSPAPRSAGDPARACATGSEASSTGSRPGSGCTPAPNERARRSAPSTRSRSSTSVSGRLGRASVQPYRPFRG